MEQDFQSALDELITRYKARGNDLDEMVADLKGATEGLEAELNADD